MTDCHKNQSETRLNRTRPVGHETCQRSLLALTNWRYDKATLQ